MKSYRNMLIILKVLILMKFYNTVKYIYKCMCSGNASHSIPATDTGKGCYMRSKKKKTKPMKMRKEIMV